MSSEKENLMDEKPILPLRERLDLLKAAKRMNNSSEPAAATTENSLKIKLEEKKRLLQSIDLSKLPDGGERLKNQIADIENALKQIHLSDTKTNSHLSKTTEDLKGTNFKSVKTVNLPSTMTSENSKLGKSDSAKFSNSPKQLSSNGTPLRKKPEDAGNENGPRTYSRFSANPLMQLELQKMTSPHHKQQNGSKTPNKFSIHGHQKVATTPQKQQTISEFLGRNESKTQNRVLQQGNQKIASIQQTQHRLLSNTTAPFKIPQSTQQFKSAASINSQFVPHNVIALPITNSLSHTQYTQPMRLTDLQRQQLFADRPQLMSLYGGRMNESRKLEVQSVTIDRIKSLHNSLQTCPSASDELSDPPNILVPLMKHQRQALAWMIWREKQDPPGGILADDMGLGKTLTILSLILKRRELNSDNASENTETEVTDKNLINSKCNLILCPASIINQWEKEFQKRVARGVFKCVLYHGPNRESNMKKLAANDIVISSYEIIRSDVGNIGSTGRHNITSIIWESIVLDEGHNIKNYKSKTALAVCQLRSRIRWVSTGTPLHNDLMDMFSLLRFLRFSPFDEQKVWKKWVSDKAKDNQVRLNTIVRSIMLRRTKNQKGTDGEQMVKLPSKENHCYTVKLSPDEQRIYSKVFEISKKTLKNLLKQRQMKENENGQKKFDEPVDKSVSTPIMRAADLLVLLLRLRQCCCHLSLIKKQGLDSKDDDILDDETDILTAQMGKLTMNDKNDEANGVAVKTIINSIPEDTPYFIPSTASSKIELLLKKLDEVHSTDKNGVKSVIVSQWTSVLNIIESHLKEKGFKCHVISGQVPLKARAVAIEDFNNNPNGKPIMLLSLRAGGVGLNLIGGSHLFIFDLHWNPQLESQACDRIYRVGQTRDVHIHKFLCENTIEEKIADLQKQKMQLASNVLSGTTTAVNRLTLDDMKMLFGIKQTHS